MSFLNELKTAYQDSQKSKLWTDEIKQTIQGNARNGATAYTHYFDKYDYSQTDIDSFCETVRSESLTVRVSDYESWGSKYYEVTISGWAV